MPFLGTAAYYYQVVGYKLEKYRQPSGFVFTAWFNGHFTFLSVKIIFNNMILDDGVV